MLCSLAEFFQQVRHIGFVFSVGEFGEHFFGGAAADAPDGRYYLKLAGAFVNGGYARVAGVTFAGVIAHKPAATKDLHGVVSDGVTHFGAVIFAHWRQHCGAAFVFSRIVFKFFSLVFVFRWTQFEGFYTAYFQIDDAGGFVKKCPAGFDGDLHIDEHIANGGEFFDGDTELLSAGGVIAGDAEGCLGDAERLGGYADTRAVHKAHDIFDQASLSFADEFAGGVVEKYFAGWRAVYSEFVFESANVNGRPPVTDEEAKSESAASVGFATGHNEQDFTAAVCDETLDTVEEPVAVVILKGAEIDRLQIGAGIGLGKHHCAGDFAGGEIVQVLLLDILGGEGIYRFGDTLEAEDVHQ